MEDYVVKMGRKEEKEGREIEGEESKTRVSCEICSIVVFVFVYKPISIIKKVVFVFVYKPISMLRNRILVGDKPSIRLVTIEKVTKPKFRNKT